MSTLLKLSSELQQSSKLIEELLIAIPASYEDATVPEQEPRTRDGFEPEAAALFGEHPDLPEKELERISIAEKMPAVDTTPPQIQESSEFVSDRLETLLANLCRQSGFHSAIVADEQGLPIGGINAPISTDMLAAFSSVLGVAIDKVPYFFEHHEANNISVDIGYVDKVVVRKFLIQGAPFFLLIICPQDIDERAYIELFSDQITSLLER